MLKFKICELIKENEDKYLDKVADLEEIVLENMEKNGKIGQLFITGKEDISEYARSENNTVMIAVDDNEDVQAATYITQGQKPFTYNDITKYFKYGDNYKQYVKSLYSSSEAYKKDLLDIYYIKIKAFKYAKEIIMKKNPQYKNILQYLDDEIKNNEFHEKSNLREDFNKYMSEYIDKIHETKRYERFYWTTSEDIAKEFDVNIDKDKVRHAEIREYERLMELEEKEYMQILKKGNLVIHEKPEFDETKYYNANTENTVEIDTYITSPNQRHTGIARILVYEGIKKHIDEQFKNPENSEIYFCSTLHRKNLSSKYVSEFFGLTDSLFVKRRQGRDREVHICKIEKENVNEYINNIQDKLIVLYGYNPTNKKLTNERQIEILKEQLKYEKAQFKRLNGIRHGEHNYTGVLDDMHSKSSKILKLKSKLQKCKEKERVEEIGK